MPKIMHLEAQPFGDGAYRMALGSAQVFELETGISPTPARSVSAMMRRAGARPRALFELSSSIMAGRIESDDGTVGHPFRSIASKEDICEVVRLGLIGGGSGVVNGKKVEVDDIEADRLIRDFGPPHIPLMEMWDIAAAILYAYTIGIDYPVAGA